MRKRGGVFFAGLGWAFCMSSGLAAIVEEALDGPMRETPEFVYCTRARYDDGHWYANIGYYCDDEAK